MVISETYGAQSGQALKENAPHEAGHYLNLGGTGRNRTTDTRIFKYPPIDRFRFDFKGLGHQF